jgi:cytochrome P450
MAEIEFDHHAEGFQQERWEVYRGLRNACPVARSSTYGGFWTVARYADVFEIARDDVRFSSARQVVIPNTDVRSLVPLQSDPPELARFRALLSPYLSPKAVKVLEPKIESIVDACLKAVLPAGECEAVEALCDPLPARMTLHLLGLEADYRKFSEPLHLMSYAEPGSTDHQRGEAGVHEFESIIVDAVDARIAKPRDDMISGLLKSEYEGTKTSREDVLNLVRMTIFGGFDTVFAALGSILVLLDERRDLRDRLISDPELIPLAIEEFLRFDAPVQGFARTTTEPCVIGGREIAQGETVFMLWASANRDEAVFDDPDDLILDRRPNRHMTFGIGGHRCLGSTLARAELRIALTSVLREMPDYEVVRDALEFPRSIGIIAGIKRVPLRFTPRP